MKTKISGLFGAISLILLSASAFSDSVVQVWTCKVLDDNTMDDVVALSEAWIRAAKGMEGGEDLEVYLEFPLAANAGGGEFNFVLIAPDVKTWGLFNNGYSDSPAEEADNAWLEAADCSGSDLWQSVEMK